MAGICGVLLVTQCQGSEQNVLFYLLIHHKTECFLFLKALFLNYTYISLGKSREKSDVRHT